MVERICPQCQYGNPLDNRFCGQCGAPMEPEHAAGALVASGQPGAFNLAITEALPPRLKQVGQAVAVGLVALAAEAGLAWLRNRIERIGQPAAAPAGYTPVVLQQAGYPAHQPVHVVQAVPPTTLVQQAPPRSGMVTVVSQRVVEVWEHGTLQRQTVERNIWRREEG